MATTYPMVASLKGFEFVSLPYENCVYIPSHVIGIAIAVLILKHVQTLVEMLTCSRATPQCKMVSIGLFK
ncbi:hypothetical protein T08_4211 [Trichinella sp. T8]|nr:hypothetical protein T08_4211 [Trichinella sp. T8]